MRFLTLARTMIVLSLISGCQQAPNLTSFVPPPNATDREVIEGINPPQYFEYLDEGGNDIYPAVVMIADINGNLIASGVLIKPDVVLTAAHCLDGGNVFSVENGDEAVMVKEVVMHESYNEWIASNDIGLIFLECPMSAKPIELWGGGDYPRMSDITTVGYGAGHKKWSKDETFFYYGTIVEEPWFIKFLPLYGPIWHGDSGGAVLYDGKLIGVISSYTMHYSHGKINVVECSATSIRMYKHWIEGALKNERMDKQQN
jgi:hypothetical protein